MFLILFIYARVVLLLVLLLLVVLLVVVTKKTVHEIILECFKNNCSKISLVFRLLDGSDIIYLQFVLRHPFLKTNTALQCLFDT